MSIMRKACDISFYTAPFVEDVFLRLRL